MTPPAGPQPSEHLALASLDARVREAVARSRIVELHRGSVSAASPGPGNGSTFTVVLPLCGNPSGSETAPAGRRTDD